MSLEGASFFFNSARGDGEGKGGITAIQAMYHASLSQIT